MKWLVLLLLSLLGVAMGYATLLHINLRMEQLMWMVVFILSSLGLFRFVEEKHFLHGFLLGVIDCLWTYIVHMVYYPKYLASHPDMALLISKLEPGMNPYVALGIVDMTKCIFYAVLSGIFAVVINAGIRKLYQ